MDRLVDLDEAAALLLERVERWRSAGLEVGEMTWRDWKAKWPQPLETDRARVNDPDSLGVVISGSGEAELQVVLFRGGWADVDFFDGLDDLGVIPASDIASASGFAALMDQWVVRVFGSLGSVQ
ncbi:hypothetical protein EF910_00370 [Streptomyces sp. WAC07149]|uniref:hypothetical protein n=1 Tax=Streptomyces sp. WAC07149 TaxID=2487425 RepID=UPI000F76F5D8|nr:hypothetical protein [Streptomyces sp. WAC07149]RST08740.1 hypothetical protein EF910_00370 [Streptomyces sp. WAC07149]